MLYLFHYCPFADLQLYGIPRWFSGKEPACHAGDTGDTGLSLGLENPLEKEMATHSSLAWEMPWTAEPGRLQSMGSQKVSYN